MPTMRLNDSQDEKPAPIAPHQLSSLGAVPDLMEVASKKNRVRWASNLVTYEPNNTLSTQSLNNKPRVDSRKEHLSKRQRTAKTQRKEEDVSRNSLTPWDNTIAVQTTSRQRRTISGQYQPERGEPTHDEDSRRPRRSSRHVPPFVPEPPSKQNSLKTPRQGSLLSPQLSGYANSSFCSCYEDETIHNRGSRQHKHSTAADLEEGSMSQKMHSQLSAARDYIQWSTTPLPVSSRYSPSDRSVVQSPKLVGSTQTQIMFDDFVLFNDDDTDYGPYIARTATVV
ncbi:hypothetical protein BP5796_06891 [Coleophoma crateriformis]|uniref:Uncharacterized protein n=1 Tax=Coleophoma crateriformis TaxID=565419 RepID=A0A3D8RQ24_9HELO|nr:hypothetical protein BP5796_06891 [Coleophoma crateriformis]